MHPCERRRKLYQKLFADWFYYQKISISVYKFKRNHRSTQTGLSYNRYCCIKSLDSVTMPLPVAFHLQRFLLFFFTVLLMATACFSQNLAKESTTSYSIRHYTSEDGLPQNSIGGIEKDEYGFIWLATQGGLVRWDGNKFETREAIDKNKMSIQNMRVHGFFRNGSGELHALLNNEVIYKIHNGLISRNDKYKVRSGGFGTEDYFDAYSIEAIFLKLSSKEAYEISTSYFQYDNGEKLIRNITKKPHLLAFKIHDTLYYITPAGTVYSMKHGKQQLQKANWLFSDSRKFAVNDFVDAKMFYQFNKDPFIRLQNSFYQITRKGNDFALTHLFDTEIKEIISLYFDQEQKTYLAGTLSNGLYAISRNMFTSILNQSVKVPNFWSYEYVNHFYSQQLFPGDSIVTYGGIGFDRKGHAFLFPLKNYTTLFQDSKKNTWTTDYNAIHLYKYNSRHELTDSFQTPRKIRDIREDSQGVIWVFTNSNIYRITSDSLQIIPEYNFQKQQIETATFVNDSSLWIGTGKGLFMLDLQTRKLTKSAILHDQYIRSIQKGKEKGVWWILTYGQGYYCYRNKRFTAFPIDQHKRLLFSNLLYEDDKSTVWIGTNNGLFQASKKTLMDFADQKIKQVYYYRWDTHYGLVTNEFNGGSKPAYVLRSDGTLSLPTINGLVWFNPEATNPFFPNSPIVLDNVTLNNKRIQFTDSIVIPADFEQLRFSVTTPYWGNRNNLQLEYRLSDQADWYPVYNNEIIFTHLPSGIKHLELRKRKGLETTDLIQSEIRFRVGKHWYEKTWGQLIFALFLIGIIFASIRVSERKLRRRKAWLEKEIQQRSSDLINSFEKLKAYSSTNEMLISVIAHEIRNPLRFSSEILSGLQQNWSSIGEAEKQKYIKETGNAIIMLRKYTNQILVWTKLKQNTFKLNRKQINVNRMLEETVEYFLTTRSNKNNQITLNINTECKIVSDPVLLDILFHNIIENACKYTNNGQIRLNVALENEFLIFECSDNGIGMNSDTINLLLKNEQEMTAGSEMSYQLGYQYIHYILQFLEGNMSIQSKPKEGTTIRISIAAGNNQ